MAERYCPSVYIHFVCADAEDLAVCCEISSYRLVVCLQSVFQTVPITTTANASLISQRAISAGVTRCLQRFCNIRYPKISPKKNLQTKHLPKSRLYEIPLKHLSHPKGRSNWPIHWFHRSVPVTHDSSQRLEAKFGNLEIQNQHQTIIMMIIIIIIIIIIIMIAVVTMEAEASTDAAAPSASLLELPTPTFAKERCSKKQNIPKKCLVSLIASHCACVFERGFSCV